MPCTDCHVALDISTTNLAGTRKKHNEKLAVDGNRDTYKKNFNLSKNVNSTDPGTPTGNPEWGICISCHPLATYGPRQLRRRAARLPGLPRRARRGFRLDLQHLHDLREVEDERAFSRRPPSPAGRHRGRSSTPSRASSRTMSPRLAGHGSLRFLPRGRQRRLRQHRVPRRHLGANPTPRPAERADGHQFGGHETQRRLFPGGVDCETCHTHKDPQGGWGASASCDDCHNSAGVPNLTGIARTHTDANESLTYHDLHADSPTGRGLRRLPHPQRQDGQPEHRHAHGRHGELRRPAPDDGAQLFRLRVRHGQLHERQRLPRRRQQRVEARPQRHRRRLLRGLPRGRPTKTLGQGGYPAPNKSSATKHTKHINNTAYVPGDCDDCHGANATTGGQTGHMNGTAETAVTAKLTSYTKATKTCVTSCHLANTTNDWTDAVAAGLRRLPRRHLRRRRREHAGDGAAHRRAHRHRRDARRQLPYNGGGSTADCTTCHAGGDLGDARQRDARHHRRACSTRTSASPTARRRPARRASPAATPTSSPASAPGAASGTRTATATDGNECAGCHGGPR